MQCSAPRASSGLIRLLASIAPSALPAPTSVCSSSMNRMTSPSAASISFSTAFSRSSNSPRNLDPATIAPRSSDISRLLRSASGTSPLTMRSASPSTMAVLPTPGSPISTGLFLVRRARIWMVRRISSSRPITGSSLPSRPSCGHVAGVFLQRVEIVLRVRAVHLAALADVGNHLVERRRGHAGAAQRAGSGRVAASDRQQQPILRNVIVARLGRGLLRRVEHADQLRRDLRLAGGGTAHLRQASHLGIDGLLGLLRVAARGADQPGRGAFLIIQQRLEQVLGRQTLMELADGDSLCGL